MTVEESSIPLIVFRRNFLSLSIEDLNAAAGSDQGMKELFGKTKFLLIFTIFFHK